MYEINYIDRAIFKNIDGTIYQVVIDKENLKPILFRYERTDNNYKILSEEIEKTDDLDKIIEILQDDLNEARAIAKEYFAGMTDRAGVDYFQGHLSSVAKQAVTLQGEIIAYLHDLLEDTSYNFYDLNNKFGQVTARSVLSLTRPAELSYEEYLNLIINPMSKEVKICDLKNNSDRSRLSEITAEDEKRFEKYKKALEKFGDDPRAVYKK